MQWMPAERVVRAANSLGVIESGRSVPGMDERAREKLDAFVAALLKKNAALNLTAARTADAVEDHVRDALFLVPHVHGPLVDIGSGGGFPAIVLAIATGVRCTLVESLAKKAAFLRDVVRDLELDVEVLAKRAEDVARDAAYRATFSTATARAVGSATTVLELTIPFLVVGGRALLQRGRDRPGERQALADASLVLGAEIEAELADPQSDARRVVVARKVMPTGERFPRRAGVPAKRPLCWTPREDEALDG
jgi:16S rRNA (guanine527-N7)-methyltransferase